MISDICFSWYSNPPIKFMKQIITKTDFLPEGTSFIEKAITENLDGEFLEYFLQKTLLNQSFKKYFDWWHSIILKLLLWDTPYSLRMGPVDFSHAQSLPWWKYLYVRNFIKNQPIFTKFGEWSQYSSAHMMNPCLGRLFPWKYTN